MVNKRGHILVQRGHVYGKRGDSDEWCHHYNEQAETALLIQCLSRVADPQRVQDSIRVANKKISILVREKRLLEEEFMRLKNSFSKETRDLENEIIRLQNN